MHLCSRPVLTLVSATLLILALLCAGCASPAAPAQPAVSPLPAGSGSDTVLIQDFAFSPAVLTVQAGTTVTWTNQDSVPHAIAPDAGFPAPVSSDSLPRGASYRFTFTSPGTYPYHCAIHPSMKGTVIVT